LKESTNDKAVKSIVKIQNTLPARCAVGWSCIDASVNCIASRSVGHNKEHESGGDLIVTKSVENPVTLPDLSRMNRSAEPSSRLKT
jgi:hypothetical protein